MSTVAVFNGFGQYEQTNDGQKGITLSHAGIPFWLPYDKVTYLPDMTIREVDHRESASDGDEMGVLTYQTLRLSGDRIAEELLEPQVPVKNKDKGIIIIQNETLKRKNSYVTVSAGVDELGRPMTTEVQELEPTPFEIEEAHRRARAYKEAVINVYLQSKRERMTGGIGQSTPTGLTRVFMDELGINDIDDVTKYLEKEETKGISNEQFLLLVEKLLAQSKSASTTPGSSQSPAKPLVPKQTGVTEV